MGTMKKHLGAYSCESSQLVTGDYSTGTNHTYIPCKATDGTSLSTTYITSSSHYAAWWHANTFSMRGLTPIATADKIEDFDVNDYTITAVVQQHLLLREVSRRHKQNSFIQ